MKYKISTSIYGMPVKLHLRIDLLYGNKEQYRIHVLHKEYSLDNGGEINISNENLITFLDEMKEKEKEGLI